MNAVTCLPLITRHQHVDTVLLVFYKPLFNQNFLRNCRSTEMCWGVGLGFWGEWEC